MYFIYVALITFFALPFASAHAENYKGVWACIAMEAFTYRNRDLKLYEDQKFFLKITEYTVTFSGKDMSEEPLRIVSNSPSLAAANRNEIFKFGNKKAVLSMMRTTTQMRQ